MKKLRIAIVGAGRMGAIRAHSAGHHARCRVVEIVDTNLSQARKLAGELDCAASPDWTRLLDCKELDAVVVATTHKHLAPISAAMLHAGKHVFCEKPMARTSAEAGLVLRELYNSWPPAGPMVSLPPRKHASPQCVIGFTLRHHPSIRQARELVAAEAIGWPMYVLGRYGHGGRPGYEQEWRASRDEAGGGELLDQGVHLIDLSRWFLGDFQEVSGYVSNYVWRAGHATDERPLEDNAFLLLRSAEGQIASLHASWTQWKNLFAFEVYGEKGSIHVRGLGGSYGPGKLVVSHRRAESGEPHSTEVDFPEDRAPGSQTDVWASEWESFVNRVEQPCKAQGMQLRSAPERAAERSGDRGSDFPSASAIDAWEALRIVEAAYQASRGVAASPLLPAGAVHSSAAVLS